MSTSRVLEGSPLTTTAAVLTGKLNAKKANETDAEGAKRSRANQIGAGDDSTQTSQSANKVGGWYRRVVERATPAEPAPAIKTAASVASNKPQGAAAANWIANNASSAATASVGSGNKKRNSSFANASSNLVDKLTYMIKRSNNSSAGICASSQADNRADLLLCQDLAPDKSLAAEQRRQVVVDSDGASVATADGNKPAQQAGNRYLLSELSLRMLVRRCTRGGGVGRPAASETCPPVGFGNSTRKQQTNNNNTKQPKGSAKQSASSKQQLKDKMQLEEMEEAARKISAVAAGLAATTNELQDDNDERKLSGASSPPNLTSAAQVALAANSSHQHLSGFGCCCCSSAAVSSAVNQHHHQLPGCCSAAASIGTTNEGSLASNKINSTSNSTLSTTTVATPSSAGCYYCDANLADHEQTSASSGFISSLLTCQTSATSNSMINCKESSCQQHSSQQARSDTLCANQQLARVVDVDQKQQQQQQQGDCLSNTNQSANKSLLSVGSGCQMSEHSNVSSRSIATASGKDQPATGRKLSGKDKKKRQKEAEKVEKLRMLVSYLKSGTSQQLLNPVALEADELELAQRYKMHLILCEDCLQATESRQEMRPGIRHNQTSMVEMHYHHRPICGTKSDINNNSNSNNNDNFDTNSSASQNMAFMSSSCRSVPLDSASNGVDQCAAPQSTGSNFGDIADSGIHVGAEGGGQREAAGSNPHIGTVSWVLRHSISDPGNNNYNANQTLATSATTPARQPSPMMGAHEALSATLYESDFPRCANCGAKRTFGSSYDRSFAIATSDQQQEQQVRKLFYIDDLDQRKDSDSSDTNSQLAALSLAASAGDFERCNANQFNNDNNNNVSPAHSKIISQAGQGDASRNTPPPPPQSNVSSSQLPPRAPAQQAEVTTRGWSSEMMIFSSTPATASLTTSATSPNNANQTQISKLSCCSGSPRSCFDIHHHHNHHHHHHHDNNNNNNHHHNHQLMTANSAISNINCYPSAQQEITGTNDNNNYLLNYNNNNNNHQLLHTIDAEQQQQQFKRSPVEEHRKLQQQTSAWENPQNLATWIDNEVNSLINDLAKSQFITSNNSKERPAKGSKRRWLSSSNRRGSSGAHSN